MSLNKYFIFTSHQKILSFLSKYPHKEFFDKEISDKTGLSRGATNTALKKLTSERLLLKKNKGKMNFYKIDIENPILRSFKVLENVIGIMPLISKLKNLCRLTILYGSAKDGVDSIDSDVDMLIVSNELDEVYSIVNKHKTSRKIQAVIKTPVEYSEMETKDPVFYNEVSRGITLWEQKQ
ncbi:MAG: helix-turn-helix transcriptional regulator [Candidatus Omnitrophica bacterium]|nr:helix-turn-helix transcriptional regulator [Candidatus Omnitrophota bacterium]